MLLGSCAVGQGKLLYPKARFQYAYPMHAVELRRFDTGWVRQAAVPKRWVADLVTWPVPIPESGIESFGDGQHVVLSTKGEYTDDTVHFLDFAIVVAQQAGSAFKVEVSHHRTAVWGCIHAWRYLEWAGDSKDIPESYPIWAMYELVYTGIESGKGVFSSTNAYRVSHLRVGGAGEEFIGEIASYIGSGEDNVERTGLRFRRRKIHFSVEVAVHGGRALVKWTRGATQGEWREDPVHDIEHMKDWREQVNEVHANPPKPKPMESEFFCLLGSKKRGLRPAKVSSILDTKTWAKRREEKERPLHLFSDATRFAYKPVLRKRTGFVRRQGNKYKFVCKRLGISHPLDVPKDLEPILAAWLDNFPR